MSAVSEVKRLRLYIAAQIEHSRPGLGAEGANMALSEVDALIAKVRAEARDARDQEWLAAVNTQFDRVGSSVLDNPAVGSYRDGGIHAARAIAKTLGYVYDGTRWRDGAWRKREAPHER